mmetsp:Transcript_15567/g.33965  ORF Transcript_15567/g.33965 Transcript_15567/m.33965 type:complete len:239 (-) Transcript_15567:50-766(-)
MKFKSLSFTLPLGRKRTPLKDILLTEDEEEPYLLPHCGMNDHLLEDQISVIVSDGTDSTLAIEESFSRSFSSCEAPKHGILKCSTLLDSLERELVAAQPPKTKTLPKKARKLSKIAFSHVTVHYHRYMIMDKNYDLAEGPLLALGEWTASEVFEDLDQYIEDLGYPPSRRDDDLYIRPALRRFLLWQERDTNIDEACSALADYHTDILFSNMLDEEDEYYSEDMLDDDEPYPEDEQEC